MLWQGGEPTLRGLGFFERLVELCERYRRPTQRVRHALQTNGTLVSDEWARFFADHEFLVGVSIDGPAHMHDAYRLNRGGHGTHAMVVRGWEALARAGVETNILCTVNAANEEHGAQVYRYFRDELGARYLQFIPIVERVRAADLAQAERGWRSGTSALLYRQDYACDHWVEPDWLVGSITSSSLSQLAASDKMRDFARLKPDLDEECRACAYLCLCWGGCPKDRFVRRGERAHNYLCEGYRAFYEHATPALRAIGILIAAGRQASDIMDPALAASLGVRSPTPAPGQGVR